MKTVAHNRRARFDFAFSDTLLAGMILTGPEVKSCRAGHVDLSGAYVSFLGPTPVLKQCTIAPYRFAVPDAFDPKRDRPLLLSKKDIERLKSASNEKGVSVIPLEVQAGKHVKILLGIGRGRKTIDKRQRIKEKDIEKRLRRGEKE
jgi:SsrA-binding protein